MVRRIYVEKQRGFDIEAQGLYEDLKENLNLEGLESVRVINRYDMEGMDEASYQAAKYTVFAEPAIDCAFDEAISIEAGSRFFAVEFLPGQYDQRADSAAQCLKLLNVNTEAVVQFARLIVLSGNLSDQEFTSVKEYCINPVDSHEAALDKPEKLELLTSSPEKVKVLEGFTEMADEEIAEYRNEQGFAMSSEDLKFVRDYFESEEGRNPTVTEVKVIDTYWSDHCRHTTFLTKIKEVSFKQDAYSKVVEKAFQEYLNIRDAVYGENANNRDMSLMDMAVIGAKYIKKKGLAPDLDESDEINACSIKVKADIDGREEDWLVMFKNETHNHPTEIEPFGGAATCLGGAIRDPLSGRVYVYQAMRVTGSGDPRTRLSDTLPGKLPQRIITKGAARGYSSYGNQIGLATGQVTEIYHDGYMAKRMEIGAVIGAAPASHVYREQPASGDCIVLIGGRTGRDGCGGATGSSKGHTLESILTCGAEVQKGNPPVERNIQRLYRKEEAARLIKRCNDFGAGGVSVAIGELADGIDVNLDLVPKKYEGLDGTELAISESQERMAAVIAEKDIKEFIQYAEEENLEAVVVAKVTEHPRFRMFWRGDCILDLSRAFLDTNGVKQEITVSVSDDALGNTGLENQSKAAEDVNGRANASTETFTKRIAQELKASVAGLNACSQKGLIEMFDSTIGAGTILMPLGGMYQLSPAAGMAAKLPVTSGDTNTATLMTYGFDPQLSSQSPFHGAYFAVIDSVTKIAAMGGDISKVRLTFQEYFERLGDDPEKWGKPFAALLGALKAQKELELPAIGGKDSMSGSFMDLHVPPTLVSFAVGISEASSVVSTELKRTNSRIVLLSPEKDCDGLLNHETYRETMKRIRKLAMEGKILSANTVGEGGLFVSLFKMAAGNKIGVSLMPLAEEELKLPDYGALLLEIDNDLKIEEIFETINFRVIGFTRSNPAITARLRLNYEGPPEVLLAQLKQSLMNPAQEQLEPSLTDPAQEQLEQNLMEFDLDELIKAWTEPLEGVFPTIKKSADAEKAPVAISCNMRESHRPAIKIARPRVFIPVFPGTNCEVDTKRAFEKAGAEADVMILRNLKQAELIDSIEEMVKKIKNSQMIMIPGGFSGGDEPDGSAKFITAVFRNPSVKEAVEELLQMRDGLMLGICNGFQALIKLGLVPFGRITEPEEGSPTLTYNRIGRHASCLVRTRIASVKSPWLANTEVGEVHTVPVSHGEGRFIAADGVIEGLIRNGQIATQYVDLDGKPSMETRFNPNASVLAIEGITSPDGRVFGKMAHSERIGENLYRNVPGSNDQRIFEAGTSYFL
ncbi:phosphoribosylformylglycinamidine synthase [Anoxybacterium hadale]|uniref:Phosphoribosylformylglycinamidine synthase n=1 Tax=Anoxybacterium hadale TaxID=3408580 RepID=A0ACD1AE90_9FIRM|nr:phosphoribosylformylglycinamidine synthase [Clostridiales bacterium]